jgi:hypothetical protein
MASKTSSSANALDGTAEGHGEKVYLGELSDVGRRIEALAVLKRFDSEALPKLIERAGIPEACRTSFWHAVLDALHDCLLTQGSIHAYSELRKNPSFAGAVDALKSARQALTQIDESAREAFRGGVLEVQGAIDDFLTALDELNPEPRRINPLRQEGRPAGAVQNSASQDFVRKLLECAILNGGALTLEKNNSKGSLIEALALLAPYLPEGVDPEKLSASTLQRIVTTHRKRYVRHRTRN